MHRKKVFCHFRGSLRFQKVYKPVFMKYGMARFSERNFLCQGYTFRLCLGFLDTSIVSMGVMFRVFRQLFYFSGCQNEKKQDFGVRKVG